MQFQFPLRLQCSQETTRRQNILPISSPSTIRTRIWEYWRYKTKATRSTDHRCFKASRTDLRKWWQRLVSGKGKKLYLLSLCPPTDRILWWRKNIDRQHSEKTKHTVAEGKSFNISERHPGGLMQQDVQANAQYSYGYDHNIHGYNYDCNNNYYYNYYNYDPNYYYSDYTSVNSLTPSHQR
jgi:hypothetical protein